MHGSDTRATLLGANCASAFLSRRLPEQDRLWKFAGVKEDPSKPGADKQDNCGEAAQKYSHQRTHRQYPLPAVPWQQAAQAGSQLVWPLAPRP
jgi:hypothetical protein